VGRDAKTAPRRRLRQLSERLAGRSAELINGFEPDQQVAVRVLDDETVEIKVINASTD